MAPDFGFFGREKISMKSNLFWMKVQYNILTHNVCHHLFKGHPLTAKTMTFLCANLSEPMLHPCTVHLDTYIYHKNQPNVGKYTIHGCYGEFITANFHIICRKKTGFAKTEFWHLLYHENKNNDDHMDTILILRGVHHIHSWKIMYIDTKHSHKFERFTFFQT